MPGGRVTGTGAQATPAYQPQQNQDAIAALTLLSNLRGPENAFAYANTLANLPDSIRNTIGAAMQNLPTAYGPRNPAQAGLLGDVTGGGQAQLMGGQGDQTGQVMGGQTPLALPPATRPRTAPALGPAQQAAMQAYQAGAPAVQGGGLERMPTITPGGGPAMTPDQIGALGPPQFAGATPGQAGPPGSPGALGQPA